jgi:hypothetical protein
MDKPYWIDELFSSIDAKDTERFVKFLTKDGTFIFANYPPVSGRDNLIGFLNEFFKSIKALNHNVRNYIFSGNNIAAEGIVTYTRLSGTELTVKFCNVFTLENNLIKNYNIYIDASQLYVE